MDGTQRDALYSLSTRRNAMYSAMRVRSDRIRSKIILKNCKYFERRREEKNTPHRSRSYQSVIHDQLPYLPRTIYIYTHTHFLLLYTAFLTRCIEVELEESHVRDWKKRERESSKRTHRRGRGRAFGSKKRASARALAARGVCVRAHARARNIPRGRHTRERGKVGRPDRVLQAKEPRYVVAMVVTEKSGVACGH